MNKLITFIIPAYGNWNLVNRNLESIFKYESDYCKEIIVIDDFYPEPYCFKVEDSRLILVRNSTNLGYAGTVNKGLLRAKGEIVILLDSDAFILEPISKKVIQAFTENKLLGCLAFKCVRDGEISSGSFEYGPSLFSFLLGKRIESWLEILPLKFTNKKILPYSCTVAYRSKCLVDVGLLDDKVFPVLDADTDLALRIYNKGWQVKLMQNLRLFHKGGESYKLNSKRVVLAHIARWRLLQKHGFIKFERLYKVFIVIRLAMEILVAYFFKLMKLSSSERLSDIIKGRIELITKFNPFNSISVN
jgi:GT2 family glycosyltransferase